jgi:dolichyl-phosphate-mannose-protein mannosyltransferase
VTRRSGIALALLGLALAIRLTFALAMPNDEPDDGRVYSLMAHNLVANGIYSNDFEPPYESTYVRVPGYPLLLAAVYEVFGDSNNTAVRVVQAFIDTGTCVLVALLALTWSPRAWSEERRQRAALAALALAAVCPFVSIYVTTILTETLASALGMGVLLCASIALRNGGPRWLWGLTGVLGGAMSLVRPESGLYVAAVGVALMVGDSPQTSSGLGDSPQTASGAGDCPQTASGAGDCPQTSPRVGDCPQDTSPWARTFKDGTALTLGFLVTLAPWTIRNAIEFRTFQPLNPRSLSMPGEFVADGYAAWLRSWIDHPRYVAPLLFALGHSPISIDQVPARAFDSAGERDEVAALFKRYDSPGPDAEADESGSVPLVGITPELDAAFADIARARAARHPFRHYVILPVKRALMLWFDPHADYYPFGGYIFPWEALDRDRNQQFWLPLFVALTLAWTAAGWLGALVLWRDKDARLWLMLAALIIVSRLVLLSSMENPEPRYTMQFFPIITAMAGCALARERRV